MLVTTVLTPIAAGLLTTLKVDTGLSALICYQGLLGFAAGIGFQGPANAVQTILSAQDVSIAIAAIQFSQNLGPAIFIPVAQTIFSDRLTTDLATFAPHLSSTSIQNMGFGDLKNHISPENLQGVLLGYDAAINETFFVIVALTCATLLGSAGMEWRSVKKKRACR